VSEIRSIRRFRSGALRVCAVAIMCLCGVGSCASYSLQRQTRRHYPRIVPENAVACFVEPVPETGYKVLATIDSFSATTATVEMRERQLAQLRKAASRAGAEAVYGVQLITRQTRGWIRDPYTPRWLITPTQGWTDRYLLRGVAVISESRLPADFACYQTAPRHPAPEDAKTGAVKIEMEAGPSPHADPLQSAGQKSWNDLIQADEKRPEQ